MTEQELRISLEKSYHLHAENPHFNNLIHLLLNEREFERIMRQIVQIITNDREKLQKELINEEIIKTQAKEEEYYKNLDILINTEKQRTTERVITEGIAQQKAIAKEFSFSIMTLEQYARYPDSIPKTITGLIDFSKKLPSIDSLTPPEISNLIKVTSQAQKNLVAAQTAGIVAQHNGAISVSGLSKPIAITALPPAQVVTVADQIANGTLERLEKILPAIATEMSPVVQLLQKAAMGEEFAQTRLTSHLAFLAEFKNMVAMVADNLDTTPGANRVLPVLAKQLANNEEINRAQGVFSAVQGAACFKLTHIMMQETLTQNNAIEGELPLEARPPVHRF